MNDRDDHAGWTSPPRSIINRCSSIDALVRRLPAVSNPASTGDPGSTALKQRSSHRLLTFAAEFQNEVDRIKDEFRLKFAEDRARIEQATVKVIDDERQAFERLASYLADQRGRVKKRKYSRTSIRHWFLWNRCFCTFPTIAFERFSLVTRWTRWWSMHSYKGAPMKTSSPTSTGYQDWKMNWFLGTIKQIVTLMGDSERFLVNVVVAMRWGSDIVSHAAQRDFKRLYYPFPVVDVRERHLSKPCHVEWMTEWRVCSVESSFSIVTNQP